MSEEELENKMKQILDDYAPILNVTPEAALLDQKPSQTKTKKKEKEPESIAANQTSNTDSSKENKARAIDPKENTRAKPIKIILSGFHI